MAELPYQALESRRKMLKYKIHKARLNDHQQDIPQLKAELREINRRMISICIKQAKLNNHNR